MYAAVTGDQRTHIFHPEVALDHTDGEIAQLPADADDESR